MSANNAYVAVIFTSVRTENHQGEYAIWASRMDELVRAQPGFIEYTSVRDPITRFGITVAYFADDASAVAWKQLAEHVEAQRLGREIFYSEYSVRVATVYRSYEFMAPQ
ncbi:MAG: antibiotic biosynthesis monooxygenase [Actinobacteria bacterium]|uniref:Unannotated protein n=1 Tax=freshwater metagenome TaxID=449393 RepID=A0A6J6UKC0_9ZZZZ|nr:antibiotic biosynthesis monooxygenase [Actinomycetota bacterium]